MTEDRYRRYKESYRRKSFDIQMKVFAKELLRICLPAGRQVHFKAMRKLAAEHRLRLLVLGNPCNFTAEWRR